MEINLINFAKSASYCGSLTLDKCFELATDENGNLDCQKANDLLIARMIYKDFDKEVRRELLTTMLNEKLNKK